MKMDSQAFQHGLYKGENMVRFGPSGNCDLFYELGFKDSEEAPKWLNEMGLSAYEYGFTLGFLFSCRDFRDYFCRYNGQQTCRV